MARRARIESGSGGGYTAHTWNNRTGEHAYELVPMGNGEHLAVWPQYDGPDFDGYYAVGPDGVVRSSDGQEYAEYRAARSRFWDGVAARVA